MQVYIIFYLLFGAASAYLAQKRGRDPFLWFCIGVLLGIFSPILLLILPSFETGADKEKKTAAAENPPPSPPPAEAEEASWYYLMDNGQQEGPVPLSQVKQLVSSGSLHAESYLWHDGMEDWKKLKECDLLARSEENKASTDPSK